MFLVSGYAGALDHEPTTFMGVDAVIGFDLWTGISSSTYIQGKAGFGIPNNRYPLSRGFVDYGTPYDWAFGAAIGHMNANRTWVEMNACYGPLAPVAVSGVIGYSIVGLELGTVCSRDIPDSVCRPEFQGALVIRFPFK